MRMVRLNGPLGASPVARLRWLVAATLFANAGFAGNALASGALGVPDSGALQVGRGGAWVARADDPLAAYTNPAAMAYQTHGVHVSTHLMIQDSCFTRVDAAGMPISPGNAIPGPGAEGGPAAATCTTTVFPNPQIAGVYRINEQLAIGMAILGPHAAGVITWPEEVEYERNGEIRTQPSPTRYMLVDQSSVLLFPTFSVAYAPVPELALGVGLTWGFASTSFIAFTESTSSSAADDFSRDVRAELSAEDLFVPGFVLGVNWGVVKWLDFGAWFRWSDAIRARSELELTSQYWLAGGTRNQAPCSNDDPACNVTFDADAGDFTFQIPMEAKLGLRFHMPLGEHTVQPEWIYKKGFVRDPLTQDRFDLEVDLTWSHNSSVESVELQFDPEIAVKQTPGFVPENGDIPHGWNDVLGVRVGGDVTVLPNLLALRAGGFFESQGQREELVNLDFHMGFKAGVSGGGTVRIGPVDVHAAYQHVFFGTLDNGGDGDLRALSGDASSGYRSQQAINGGKFEQSLNELALGATWRF